MNINTVDYEQCISLLNNDDWAKLSDTERIQVLQGIENHTANIESRNVCLVKGVDFDDREDQLCAGVYKDSIIYINKKCLNYEDKDGKTYTTALDTVLHEGRHAYQHQVAEKRIVGNEVERVIWKNNIENYVNPDKNFRRYLNQPIEVDAREFAEKRSKQIENEIQSLSKTNKSQEMSSKYLFIHGQTENKESFYETIEEQENVHDL